MEFLLVAFIVAIYGGIALLAWSQNKAFHRARKELEQYAQPKHDEALAQMTAERDRYKEHLEALGEIIQDSIKPNSEAVHRLILKDGSVHTGPAVDFIHELATVLIKYCKTKP